MIEEIKKTLKSHLEQSSEATVGPWAWHWRRGDDQAPGSIYAYESLHIGTAVAMCPRYGKSTFPSDAEFISAARTISPIVCQTLLNVIEQLETDIQRGYQVEVAKNRLEQIIMDCKRVLLTP